MSTIEEMARTLHENGYLSADMVRNWDGVPEAYKRAYRAGLLAVIEKHIGPMIAEAYEQGFVHSTGWLVERNDLGAPRWLCFGPKHRDTTYTTDANKALRFARKEDAASAMFHLENNDPVLRVTEHKWIALKPTQYAARILSALTAKEI